MAVTIGSKVSLVANADASIKPGNATQGIFIQGTSAGYTPAEIIDVTDIGTILAKATARALDSNGAVSTDGTTFTDIIVIPYRQFAQIGDKGLVASGIPVPDADNPGATLNVNVMLVPRQAFLKFTS